MDHLLHLWSSGVLLFCTTVGWEELGGTSFFLGGWLSGEDISSILFTQEVYSTHPLRTHFFRETLPALEHVVLCLLFVLIKQSRWNIAWMTSHLVSVFTSLPHIFIWTVLKWKGSLHPFPRKKHVSTPSQKYK